MPKRCPPGVFCIENYTIFAIFCILFVLTIYIFFKMPNHASSRDASQTSTTYIEEVPVSMSPFVRANPSLSFTDNQGDILLNPYAPPVNDERYLIPGQDVRGVVPINIRTQGVDAAYRQVGILTSQNSKEQILALMGRPLLTNRDQWQYYTMSERNNIKLPVSVKGKSCMNEYGCDKIYDGDTIYVQGYNGIFRATIYDNDVLRYIPIV
mgnify:CR=1 FL=1|tara:strand:- start:535 stop:1161 length:627 start_codon:yes stop_codon:yes gene_type:complete